MKIPLFSRLKSWRVVVPLVYEDSYNTLDLSNFINLNQYMSKSNINESLNLVSLIFDTDIFICL